jgi:hypothetical protein
MASLLQEKTMILKKRTRIRSFVSAGLFLLICISYASFAAAQKKPTEFDSRSDDKQLCRRGKGLDTSEYCDFWRLYAENRVGTDANSRAIAKDARNELIKYVQGHVDRFYDESVNKKKFNRNLLQTVLDFLEVGAATAIGVSNGERAKEVIGIALGGLQGMRSALNRNFDLLQTRILINKMRENRAEIMMRIVANMNKPVSDYSWLDAKNDLRQYLYAGTFGDALDSLAADTGDAAQSAETNLRIVSGDLVILPESTAVNVDRARGANKRLEELERQLADDATREGALATLKNILEELKKDTELKPMIEAGDLSSSNDGAAIITRIIEIRQQVTLNGRADLARKINEVIVLAKQP